MGLRHLDLIGAGPRTGGAIGCAATASWASAQTRAPAHELLPTRRRPGSQSFSDSESEFDRSEWPVAGKPKLGLMNRRNHWPCRGGSCAIRTGPSLVRHPHDERPVDAILEGDLLFAANGRRIVVSIPRGVLYEDVRVDGSLHVAADLQLGQISPSHEAEVLDHASVLRRVPPGPARQVVFGDRNTGLLPAQVRMHGHRPH